ncbi:MAG: hypothetical protein AABZ47_18950 [Planctomycetota bacterium]|mgnify:CR=1 FL=1
MYSASDSVRSTIRPRKTLRAFVALFAPLALIVEAPGQVNMTCIPVSPVVEGNTTVEIECFINSHLNLGIRGFQLDFPCTFPVPTGGAGILSIVSPNTDIFSRPMGSLAGIPHLSGGVSFLSPVNATNCFISNTPLPLQPPFQLPANATRYVATFVLSVGPCAGGEYPILPEGVTNPPHPTNGTRIRDDALGQGNLVWINTIFQQLTIDTGQCCTNLTCLGNLNRHCCLNVQGGQLWDTDKSCLDGCPCQSAAHCTDDNPCTDDACVDGFCQNTSNTLLCDDGLFCTAFDFCTDSMCQGANSPCTAGQFCSESLDACVECLVSADCPSDNNPCTDEVCDSLGNCLYVPNTIFCNDGLFCTRTDVCSGGVCVGRGVRCTGPSQPLCDEQYDRCIPCPAGHLCPTGVVDQLQGGADHPRTIRVSLDHLWEWNDSYGRFVDPKELGKSGVTINPDKPTYLLTHGWDGELNGNWCGTLPDAAACAALSSSDDKPEFAMSSIGAAIRRRRGNSVNLLAWDWADVANPNGCCDVSQWLNGPSEFQEALQDLLDHPSLRNVWEVLRSDASKTLCYLTSFGILNDAWRSGLAAKGEGNKLGIALASAIAAHGAIGSQFHLIGKSHGGGVLGQAAKALKEQGIRVDTLTTLDTPKVLCVPWTNACYVNSLQFIDPYAAERTFVFYYDERVADKFRIFGFGAPLEGSSTTVANLRLSPEHAPPGSLLDPTILHLWVAGNDDCECEPQTGWDGWTFNACPPDDGWYPLGIFGQGGIWFDDLLYGTSLLDLLDLQEGSLFPDGCYAESDFADFRFHSVPCESSVAAGQTEVSLPDMSFLRYDSFQSASTWFGNLTQLVTGADLNDATNRAILMQEQGDASFFKDIDWPSDALLITFDYLFREPRGEENLTVYVDNQIVYYDNAETTLAKDALTSSGAIYVGNVAGQTARLNFVLWSDQPDGGSYGGELVIDNIRVYGFLEHDSDLDGDRDLFDFAVFQNCFGAEPIPDECWAFDVDGVDGVGPLDYAGDDADPAQYHGFMEFIGDPATGGPKVLLPL